MTPAVLAFLAGIVWVQQLIRLPSSHQLLLLAILTVLLARWRFWAGVAFTLGLLWASMVAEWRLSDGLAEKFQGEDVTIQGYVANLPERQDNRVSFDFVATRMPVGFPEKLRLNWYYPQTVLTAGQSWEMTVKVKKPHGRINPGGFDYEAWLFANHIGATGYVRPKPSPRHIEPDFAFGRYFARWRQAISDRLGAVLVGSPQLGVIKALTIGNDDLITRQQWDVFRATGTVHLIVISGSHISLIAGLVFFLVRRGWTRLGWLRISPQTVASSAGWLAALFYAALAGFSIPTQRAMVMLTVGMIAIVWQRNTAPLQVLGIALLAVLMFDPLAVLSLGFWLSFVAVFLLIYISSARLGRNGIWREAAQSQLTTAIGLSPLLILFFQRVSLISPLANWLAVPVVGLLAVPLALLALLLLFVFEPAAAGLLWLADWILQALYWLLETMASWPLATMSFTQPPWYAVSLAAIGVLIILAPKGMPARYLGLFLCLPLSFVDKDKPEYGEAWLAVLDVGQGLSAVVQTERHTLVFDAGARYSEKSDMGESVLLPYLRYQGVTALDALIISHGDNDHSGGSTALLAEMPMAAIYSSVAEWAEHPRGQYCHAGLNWQWDGVDFTVLSPGSKPFETENDNSCVLKVSGNQESFLLTGDIEYTAEAWLVEQYGSQLKSSILVAPHHGSKSSSSRHFLQTVDPRLILISAGHMNRFGFPHRSVLKRYESLAMAWRNTAELGAIRIERQRVIAEREQRLRYWMSNNDAVAVKD